MVDPRIYRATLALVVIAVIVFGFSLTPAPTPASSALAPGQFFADAYQACCQVQTPAHGHGAPPSFASQFPDRAPGSSGDNALAGDIYRQLTGISGFSVSRSHFTAETADGSRPLETVTATRTGIGAGMIVVVSDRDAEGSPAAAQLSGTAVLLGLARALGGATLQRTVMLVSTSGTIGEVGAAQLANRLGGQDVDAVITLGDLAGEHLSGSVVRSWSVGDLQTPPVLRNTLAKFVHSQTGITVGSPGPLSQIIHLAFPFTLDQQAPFLAAGIPAVGLSTLADHSPPAYEPMDPVRLDGLGGAVLQTVEALETARTVPAPSSYLTIGGQLVPLWAVRLLVLALIFPVLATTVDAMARARRRGHQLITWLAWVLVGAVPFLIAVAAVVIAGKLGALPTTPAGPVAGGVVLRGGGVAVMGVAAVLAAGGSYLLRPWLLRLAAGLGARTGDPSSPRIEGAAVALMMVTSALALLLWLFNPFAALLLVPALHCWLWIADPDVRERPRLVLALALIGIAPALVVGIYYWHDLGVSLLGLVWSGVLLVAGGGLSIAAAAFWAVALGAFVSAVVLAIRTIRTPQAADAPVTVRGPVTYAGPGSLGGTESSAVRR
jgi:hypothetical protein